MPNTSSGVITVYPHNVDDLCVVAPAPEVKERLVDQFNRLRNRAAELVGRNISLRAPSHVGLNDGLIYPGTYYPLGTTAAVARRAAMDRAPLRGTVRVIVVRHVVVVAGEQLGGVPVLRERCRCSGKD